MDNEKILSLASACGLDVRLRAKDCNVWSSTLANCTYIPFSYTNSSLDYQLAYFNGRVSDHSLLIYWENKPIAVWPFFMEDLEGDENSTSNKKDSLILPPIFICNCEFLIQKKIIKRCIFLCEEASKIFLRRSWSSQCSFDNQLGINYWHLELISMGAKVDLFYDLFVDLRPDIATIRKAFRKSYRSLITSGEKLWKVNVLDQFDEEIWSKFQNLHSEVAGRITKPKAAWDSHLNDIKNGTGFLIYLNDSAQKMVGAGFFNFSRDEALYSVAAYKRELFDKPLGHIVQYHAIVLLKKLGVTWYKVGSKPLKFESPKPSEKEISIGNFKQGFSSHTFPRFFLNHPV